MVPVRLAHSTFYPFGGAPELAIGRAPVSMVAQARLQTHATPATSLRLYENFGAYPGSSSLTLDNTLAELGSGGHGTVFYVGGGDLQSFTIGTEVLGLTDVYGLANAPRYNVLRAQSDRAAEFSADSILERLVTAPNGGSAAALGFTNVVFQTTARQYSEAFYDALTATSAVRVGDAVQK